MFNIFILVKDHTSNELASYHDVSYHTYIEVYLGPDVQRI